MSLMGSFNISIILLLNGPVFRPAPLVRFFALYKDLASPKLHLLSDFLFHCFIQLKCWVEDWRRKSMESRLPRCNVFRENEARRRKIPRSTSSNHCNPLNCGELRRPDRWNQILHKIWHLWTPELRWRGLTQIIESVL